VFIIHGKAIIGSTKSHAKPPGTQRKNKKYKVFLAISATLARYHPHLLGEKDVFAVVEGKILYTKPPGVFSWYTKGSAFANGEMIFHKQV
jgi:hypothetical protein